MELPSITVICKFTTKKLTFKNLKNTSGNFHLYEWNVREKVRKNQKQVTTNNVRAARILVIPPNYGENSVYNYTWLFTTKEYQE
jgi:hypothetical protein